MTAALVGVLGGIAAVGVLVVVSAWTEPAARRVGPSPLVVWWAGWSRPLLAGAVGAVVVFIVTGWLVGLVVGFAVGVWAWRGWQHRGVSRKVEEARIDALAAWCEQLRDLLSADHGLVSTVEASVATCPAAIRPAVARLSAGLQRQSPNIAVGRFADELDDASGDLVASVLLLAAVRSSRTAEMLSELAGTIRERASMRLRVEAERAGTRSEARFVVGFTVAVVVVVVVFGRDSEFLAAYDSSDGQLVLALVAAMFVLAGRWLLRLGRFEQPERFLTATPAGGGGR